MPETSHAVMLALGFAALVILITSLARRLPVPVPILQVGAGLLVVLVGRTELRPLDPELVFFVFLPPVLWSAAYFTSFREFRQNIRSIGLLAIWLVLATTAAVAVVAHFLLPGIPWAIAIALGAIVSPPDAIAAEAVLKRLPVPRRVLVILAGESLVNDASALVLYRTAVAAAAIGHFSLGEAVVRFFIDAIVGVLIGLMISHLITAVARRTNDTLVVTLLAVVAPYAAWMIGEVAGVSAVLACVAGGLHARSGFGVVITPMSRLQNQAVWDVLLFIMNALIFIMLGMQFGTLAMTTPMAELVRTGWIAITIAVLVIVVRLVWVPVATFLPRMWSAEIRRVEPAPDPRGVGLVAWTSMRGIVSLASALALPVALADGTPWPYRNEILIISMGVILVTLVLQGLTLEPLIRRMGFTPDPTPHIEANHARTEALRHGLERLEDLSEEAWVAQCDVAALREEYRRRREHQRLAMSAISGDPERLLRAELLRAERRAVVRLRNEGAISDEVLHELERELDFDALRVGAGELN